MKSFKGFLAEGRSRGEDMEEAIVSLWNGVSISNDLSDGAQKVVDYLKTKGVSGQAKVLGASQIDVSPQWKEYWKPDKVPAMTKTPKTDITIGTHKISLKSGPSAQLMSGGKNESRATFYTALEKSGAVHNDIVSGLEDMVNSLAPSSKAATDLGQAIKDATDQAVVKANKAHKVFKTDLESYFNSNTTFADEFAYEAMSGEVKFGGNNGTADWFLTTSWDGKNVHYIPTSDKSYVSKVANKMKPSVRFKTSSVKSMGVKTGEYRYWSVIGLIVDKLDEAYAPYEGVVLTEGIWAKIKGALAGVVTWVKNLFQKIKTYVSKSWKNLIDFLEIEPMVRVSSVKF
tara:strand:+ start:427 stop:1455 length:1029 start_codon:yes stop_codon:yes gene_type:complete